MLTLLPLSPPQKADSNPADQLSKYRYEGRAQTHTLSLLTPIPTLTLTTNPNGLLQSVIQTTP